MPIFYLLDNVLYIKCNDEVFTVNLRDCVKHNYVTNVNRCIKQLNNFLKVHKKLKRYLCKDVVFVSEISFNQTIKKIMFEILEDIGINKVKFLSIENLIDIKRNDVWINITSSYWQVIFYNGSMMIDYRLFNNNIIYLVEVLINNFNIKNFVLFGNNELDILSRKIEKVTNKKTFYVGDKLTYILNLIAKNN